MARCVRISYRNMPGTSERQELNVNGRTVAVSNLSKRLYPSGFLKAQVIDYYIKVAGYLLPHLRGRPITLKRYPDGVRGRFFYEKDAPGFTPDWVRTFPVPRRIGGPDIRYIVIDDLATLVWCANAASLELHPFLHRVPEIHRPTSVVFDLDPGQGADVLTCAEVAFLLKKALEGVGLDCLPKLSGSKGIQVYVPLNTPVSYGDSQPFARTVAEDLEKRHPSLIVSKMAKDLRANKVFIDWSQNADFKTTVGVYSLRAKRSSPFVSLPVTWAELRTALRRRDAQPLLLDPDAALKRLARVGDLFAPVLKIRQRLPGAGFARGEAAKTGRTEATRSARRSRQGSRRRFSMVPEHTGYRLALEAEDLVKTWCVPFNNLRRRTFPLFPCTDNTADDFDDRSHAGTYDVIDGSLKSGCLHLHFNGSKLSGEWTLRRNEDDQWTLFRGDGTSKDGKRQNLS